MSDVINAEDDFEGLSRIVFGQMFSRLKFNEQLVRIGFCKVLIKDMNQAEYEDYRRLCWMLQQMSDTPEE